jgi:hypothetical protein
MKQQSMAEAILQQTGAITECPVHGDLVDALDNGALDEAVELGKKMIEEGELDGSPEEWEDLLRAKMEDYPMDCPACPDPARD